MASGWAARMYKHSKGNVGWLTSFHYSWWLNQMNLNSSYIKRQVKFTGLDDILMTISWPNPQEDTSIPPARKSSAKDQRRRQAATAAEVNKGHPFTSSGLICHLCTRSWVSWAWENMGKSYRNGDFFNGDFKGDYMDIWETWILYGWQITTTEDLPS